MWLVYSTVNKPNMYTFVVQDNHCPSIFEGQTTKMLLRKHKELYQNVIAS